MKPSFTLTVAGVDRTSEVADRLLSISINDEAGQKSDTVDITLDDRDNVLPIPANTAEIAVSLGYEGIGQLRDMGSYTVDEISISRNPETMKIRGKAAETSSSFKVAKTRSFHQQTIGEIIATIAGDHGLTPRVAAVYGSKMIEHIDQENESDAHFCTRLAGLYGAVSKPISNGGAKYLVFVPEGEGAAASGQALGSVTIKGKDMLSLRASIKDRGNFSGVITRYRDKEINAEIEVEVENPASGFLGATTEKFRDKKLYTSEDMARSAGEAKLKQLNTGNVQIDFSIEGNPDIFAEQKLKLRGVRDPLTSQDWIIKSVKHTFTNSGFTTAVSAHNKPAG